VRFTASDASQSSTSFCESVPFFWSVFVFACHTRTICSGRAYGSGSSSTPFTTVKIAVVAPMPNISVSSTTAVKPGVRRIERNANPTSCRSASHQSARFTSLSISWSISRQAAATRS
jgi:hypothetical protein